MRDKIITASSMTKWLTCQRSYYYRYALGFVKTKQSDALRFGTAWHRLMEARIHGFDFDNAFAEGILGSDCDSYVSAMLYGMLKAYYERYDGEIMLHMNPELEFAIPLRGTHKWMTCGKLDAVGQNHESKVVLMEHKTTSDSLDTGSSYWDRLRNNVQMLNYVDACASLDGLPDVVIYDVVKKPAIRQKEIADLDDQGLKKVVDVTTRQRVFKSDGTPRQTGGEGMEVLTRMENPEEYANRVYEDIKSRPDNYFVRREVVILDSDIKAFCAQRLVVSKQIDAAEKNAKRFGAEAYPKNCTTFNCRMCDYAMFCMSNTTANVHALPEGFKVNPAHVELEHNPVEQE